MISSVSPRRNADSCPSAGQPRGHLSGDLPADLPAEKLPKCSTVITFRAFHGGVGAISASHPKGFLDAPQDGPKTAPRRLPIASQRYLTGSQFVKKSLDKKFGSRNTYNY